MTLEAVQAFLDAADDLLAAQQQLMTQPLSVELRALTEATLALRLEVLDGAGAAIAAGKLDIGHFDRRYYGIDYSRKRPEAAAVRLAPFLGSLGLL